MAAEVKEAKKAVEEQVAEVSKDVKEAVEAPVVEAKPAESGSLVDAVHKVLLAGIGAMALAKEDMEDLVGKLVERGEIAEADGRKMMKDVMARRKKQASEQTKKAEDVLDQRVEDVMSRMNIPTKDEIEALSAKITALTKKVDELKKTA
jgi:poly(hydroxyalkanoate) granule-associated protein